MDDNISKIPEVVPTPEYYPNAEHPKVSVILLLKHHQQTIAQTICYAWSVHTETEVIVVTDASNEETIHLAESLGSKVISYPSGILYHEDRCFGATEAKGEIFLFLNGDRVIPSDQLLPFIHAIDSGIDVAYCHYKCNDKQTAVTNDVLSAYMLNGMLQRPDLNGASMLNIPLSMSRKALKVIGLGNMAVPSKAHAVAITKGLYITAVTSNED